MTTTKGTPSAPPRSNSGHISADPPTPHEVDLVVDSKRWTADSVTSVASVPSSAYDSRPQRYVSLLPQDIREGAVADHFGGKTIGYIGGLSLMINNLLGPGISDLPQLWQSAGFVPATLCLVFMAFCTLLACSSVLYAMRKVPGNDKYNLRMEYSRLLRFYFPRSYIILEAFVLMSLAVQTLATIVQTAQSMDSLIAVVRGESYGLEVYPSPSWTTGDAQAKISVFGKRVVVSLGFILLVLLCKPLSDLNLDDNIIAQVVSSSFLAVALVLTVVVMVQQGWHTDSMPLFGTTWRGMLGMQFFNFGLAVYVPSWANEKKDSVDGPRLLRMTVLISFVLFLLIAVSGAAFTSRYVGSEMTLFETLKEIGGLPAMFCVYTIPLASNLTGIPVMIIMVRYNLEMLHVPGWVASALTLLLLIATPVCMRGKGFDRLVSVGGALFTSAAGFVIPCMLYGQAHVRAGPRKCSMGVLHFARPRFWHSLWREVWTGSDEDDSNDGLSAKLKEPLRYKHQDAPALDDLVARSGCAVMCDHEYWLRRFWGCSLLLGILIVCLFALKDSLV